MMQVFVLAVQNSVSVRAMGSATALTQFSRSIGATLGVTIMGVIVNQGLPPAARGERIVHRLSPAARGQLAHALHPAFLVAACVCAIVFILVVFGIHEVPLRKGFEEAGLADELGQTSGAEAGARSAAR
jgi:hypothetical protein